jgi:hypothetical protein
MRGLVRRLRSMIVLTGVVVAGMFVAGKEYIPAFLGEQPPGFVGQTLSAVGVSGAPRHYGLGP